jgi:hypothetical protein
MGVPPDPTDAPDPSDVAAYARAAAQAAGLQIDDAWWPAVERHLSVLLARAGSLENQAITLPDDPAPVFRP